MGVPSSYATASVGLAGAQYRAELMNSAVTNLKLTVIYSLAADSQKVYGPLFAVH